MAVPVFLNGFHYGRQFFSRRQRESVVDLLVIPVASHMARADEMCKNSVN